MPSSAEAKGSKEIPAAYPRGSGIEWLTRRSFRLDKYEFDITVTFNDLLSAEQVKSPDRFYLFKSPDIIRRYLKLFAERMPRNIVELGVFRGGSAAFLQLVTKPARLLALELSSDRVELLDRFIRTEGLEKSVRVEYGVDQANTDLVLKYTTEHLGNGRCIDLVIDDASHLLAPTRTSFEALFPLVRPGGSYVIEDYSGLHSAVATLLNDALTGSESASHYLKHILRACLQEDNKPLHLLAVEAMLAATVVPGVIERVIVDRQWLRIVRGGQKIDDPGSFNLRTLATDHFGLLDTRVSSELAAFLE